MNLGSTKVEVVLPSEKEEDERGSAELSTLLIQRNNKIALRFRISKEGKDRVEFTVEPDQCESFLQLLKQAEFVTQEELYRD